jgi:hypothetical protein
MYELIRMYICLLTGIVCLECPRRSRSPVRNRSVSPLRNRSPPSNRYRRQHSSRSRSRSRSPITRRSRSPQGTLRVSNDKAEGMHLTTGGGMDDGLRTASSDGSMKEGEKPSLQSVVVKAGSADKPESKDNSFLLGLSRSLFSVFLSFLIIAH